jgi:hypothetical protein
MFVKNKFSVTSVTLILFSLIYILIINYKIAEIYLHAGGKTRAFFWITETITFSYKYYLIIPALLGIALAIFAIRKKEIRSLALFSIVSGMITIILVFSPVWKLFI